jgi:hypothetical protein
MELNPYAPPAAALEGAPTTYAEPRADVPLFFPVSPTKLTLLYFASFGLYQLLWFHESWKLVRDRGEGISPIARTIFGVFFCYSLFERVQDEARSHDVKMIGGAGFLAIAWIVLALAGRLPDPAWMITFLSFLPMLAVQKAVNELNRRVAPDHDPNSRFGAGAIVTMVIGFPLLLLFLAGMFMAPVE